MGARVVWGGVCGLLLLGAGCLGTRPPETGQQGRTFVYEPGAPNFDMEAVATLRDGQSGIDLYLSLPYTSLTFLQQGGRYQAAYEVLVRIAADGARAPAHEAVWADTVVAEHYAATQDFGRLARSGRVALAPGRYVVEMTLEDGVSGAQMTRRQEVAVFDAAADGPAVSAVRMMSRRGAAPFMPEVSVHVPAGFDSLRAVVELYSLPEAAAVEMTLLRFRSDTAAAVPPHWLTPSPFSLPYLGIDFAEADTLQRTRRSLRGAGEEVTVEFALPALERGNYRVDVAVQVPGEAEERVRRHIFSVKPAAFPRITTLDEMVDALVYIARPGELAHIRAGATPAERRARFDAFWAGLVPNREQAAALLKAYYARVEEANVVFSSHKAGWKTDRGMVYIVMGPPAHTEDDFNRRLWFYYRGYQRLPVLIFERSGAHGHMPLFENYILQRDVVYEEPWTRAVERWRDGEAL